MPTRRDFLKISGAATAAFVTSRMKFSSAFAQALPLPGKAIAQWADQLPDLWITAEPNVELSMEEFLSPVMPTGFVPATGIYQGTYVWGYVDTAVTPPYATSFPYIGPVILATRGFPTSVKYINNLGDAASSFVTAWYAAMDKTLHWCDPDGEGMPTDPLSHYTGPIPAVPHLHGGEIPPLLDGGPDAWFTADGRKGHAYHTLPNIGTPANANYAIYNYLNCQEAANIWFHDHGLGITRLNVYAGLAGAYLISDPDLLLPTGLTAHGIGSETIIPLVLQDRMFDTNGQLFFPNLGINPEHPYWIPEFLGDTIVVNGKVWPTIGTALAPKPSKRYRFLLLNGSNARTYELFLNDVITGVDGPPIWVIGTDGGYLDTPVKIDPNAAKPNPTRLTIMPGERYDVIIDFNDPAWRALNPNFSGQLILRNTGRTPYPKGVSPDGRTLGRIVKFFIGAPVADSGYDPASGIPLRSGPIVVGDPDQRIVRLVDPIAGTLAAGVTPAVVRQLTLNEAMGPGGPLEVLVNNTKYGGVSVATDVFAAGVRPDFTFDPSGLSDPDYVPGGPVTYDTSFYSELPNEGDTELWEIINITADAHPIHFHLVQAQLMNRQAFRVNKYNSTYNALFPGSNILDPMTGMPYPPGVYIGGFGPPLNYKTGAGTHPVYGLPIWGGNPDITPFLQGGVMPPQIWERGWKDTFIMYPGQVSRVVIRFAPTDKPVGAADLFYPFDPNSGHGYVWHCHIIDHEDNEMMRPYAVTAKTGVLRDFTKGDDY